MPDFTASVALEFTEAFLAAAKALFEGDGDVLVMDGYPGPESSNYRDWIAIADLKSGQDIATMGTSRGVEETLTLTVWVSAYRDGGAEQESVVKRRAYEMLQRLEHHMRMTDTTLGGVVRQCRLTEHTSRGATDPELIATGRMIEIESTFTASVRIRN